MTHTHEVSNQVPPHTGRDIAAHPALFEGLHREGAGWAESEVRALGALANSEPAQEWGRLANEHPPVLRTHDRFGNRIDELDFHAAWDSLLRLGLDARVQSLPWVDERAGAHVARAALFMRSEERRV